MPWTDEGSREARFATRLAERLDAPPPGLDASGAVRAARRAHLRRRRRLTAAAAALLLIAGSAAGVAETHRGGDGTPTADRTPSADYTSCDVRHLATPATDRQMTADPAGAYLVHHARGVQGVTLARGSSTVVFPYPAPGGAGLPLAVNGSGVVVGGVPGTGSGPRAWVFRNGVTTTLPTPAGWFGVDDFRVDAHGNVLAVGSVEGSWTDAVVVWRADALDTPIVTSPVPGAVSVRAGGLTDDGTIVGVAQPAAGAGWLPYAWRLDGTARLLDRPAGRTYVDVLGASGGWAFGVAFNGAGLGSGIRTARQAVRWKLTTGAVEVVRDIDPADRPSSVIFRHEGPVAVADTGALVINSPTTQVLVVGPTGDVHRLPAPAGPSDPEMAAVAISRDGRTVTGWVGGGRAAYAVAWTC